MNKFYKINLIIALALLIGWLTIGAHNLYAGCEHMFAECYLHGSDDWSIAQFGFGVLLNVALLILIFKLFMDGFIFTYVYIRKWLSDFNSRG
ncbi:hypothetical protein MCEKH37_00343 [Methylophilaceae bacterium]